MHSRNFSTSPASGQTHADAPYVHGDFVTGDGFLCWEELLDLNFGVLFFFFNNVYFDFSC